MFAHDALLAKNINVKKNILLIKNQKMFAADTPGPKNIDTKII